ncbi:MAG: BspA family leucine-rich repeat surface protein, partial [Promicromonosporaceae bacterium]|nr:BspA family leucine-rich repeat surface protein [Promicromonosporaceae bacterium]
MTSLTTLDVSNWNTANVWNMNSVFAGAVNLTALDVSNWDTSSATTMWWMFSNNASLTELDVSRWDTSNVTHMTGMFNGASGLTGIDVSNWDTSSALIMQSMFAGASGIRALDLSNWDTSSVTNMTAMFNLMAGLRELTLGEEFVNATGANPLNPSLPAVQDDETYTGRWIRVGTGSLACPHGLDTPTSAELMEMMVHEAGEVLADTWVWQLRQPGCLFQTALYGPFFAGPDYENDNLTPGYVDSVTEHEAAEWAYLADVFTLLGVPGPPTMPPPGVVWQLAPAGAPYDYYAYIYFVVRDTALDTVGTVFDEQFAAFPLRFTRAIERPTPTPSPTLGGTPTPTPSPESTPTPSPEPDPTPTPTPSPSPGVYPTPTPSPESTPTPTPTSTPDSMPSPSPESYPTPAPSPTSPVNTGPAGPRLPVTGTTLAGVGVAGILLLGGGLFLLARKRRNNH